MTKELYYFSADLAAAELQETEDDSPGTLSGYATKFNIPSSDRGGYRELFRPGAFANLLDESSSIVALKDHVETAYLGRTDNQTLKLATDAVGLRFSLILPNTTEGRDVAVLVKRKDLPGMSFAYEPDVFHWKQTADGPVREHVSGRLVEISVVFNPAFRSTSVSLNSLTEPSDAVLASLKEWLGTPIRNSAKRKLWLAEKNLTA